MKKAISPPTLKSNIKRFNYQSSPARDIAGLLASDFQIISFEISEHGKTGVFFIETKDGSFVIKSSNDGPKDQFLNRLAGMLNLNVPQSICYCCSEPTFSKIMFEIQKFCEQDEILYARIKSKLDFPFYQVLEYVPSVSLAEIGKERFEKHLLEHEKLYAMGMGIGFDLIINNSDRFKLVWRGEGNINNVLVRIEDHDTHQLKSIKNRNNTDVNLSSYVFIDHSGYLLNLKNPEAMKNFQFNMGKVTDFLVRLIRAISEQKALPEQFQKLKKQFQLYTHYIFSDFDLRSISYGIIYMIKKFLQLFETGAIDELYNNLKKHQIRQPKKRQQQNSYWYSYWNTQLLKVNISYLQEVYTKIAAVFTTYPDAIQKMVDHVGDIDDHVGNNNFNDLHALLDIKGSVASRSSASKIPSRIDIPSESILNGPVQSKEEEPKGFNQDPINEVTQPQEPTQKAEQPNKTIYKPQQPQKRRKWRQKLALFKQNNSEKYE